MVKNKIINGKKEGYWYYNSGGYFTFGGFYKNSEPMGLWKYYRTDLNKESKKVKSLHSKTIFKNNDIYINIYYPLPLVSKNNYKKLYL